MRMRWLLVPIVVLLITGLPSLHAQDASDWRLVEVRDVEDELIARVLADYPQYETPEGRRPPHRWEMLQLTPDGTQIIGWGRFILAEHTDEHRFDYLVCRFDLDGDAYQCEQVDPDNTLRRPIIINSAWSPDGTQLVLTDDVLFQQEDSDILLLDNSTLTVTNLTSDGYNGHMIGDAVPEYLPVDVAPVWSPNGNLYFVRLVHEGDSWTSALYRLVGAAGEPELVVELPEDFRTFAIWNTTRVAMSPDGSTLALIPEMLFEPPHTQGIWLVDLNTGTLTQPFTPETMQPALAEWSELRSIPDGEVPLIPRHIVWSAAGRLIVFVENPGYQRFRGPVDSINVLSLDIQANTLTPLVDFTAITTYNNAYTQPFTQPGLGILAPDGQTLVYLSRRESEPNFVFAVPVTFDAPPGVVGTIEEDVYGDILPRMGQNEFGYLLQASANRRVLLDTLLLTFAQ